MRDTSRYLHSLGSLRYLDAVNRTLASERSVARPPLDVEYTEADLAWFRRPISSIGGGQ